MHACTWAPDAGPTSCIRLPLLEEKVARLTVAEQVCVGPRQPYRHPRHRCMQVADAGVRPEPADADGRQEQAHQPDQHDGGAQLCRHRVPPRHGRLHGRAGARAAQQQPLGQCVVSCSGRPACWPCIPCRSPSGCVLAPVHPWCGDAGMHASVFADLLHLHVYLGRSAAIAAVVQTGHCICWCADAAHAAAVACSGHTQHGSR